MSARYEQFDAGFSTADVGDVVVSFSNRALTVIFSDWRGAKTTVVFYEVAAYKWDETNIPERPDQVYRVLDSDWLRSWPNSGGLTHFALGFCGAPGMAFLDVIAKELQHSTGEAPSSIPRGPLEIATLRSKLSEIDAYVSEKIERAKRRMLFEQQRGSSKAQELQREIEDLETVLRKLKMPNKAPEPTPVAVTPRAIEGESK